MNNKPLKLSPIDVHCHFFNKEVLSLHLLIELSLKLIDSKQNTVANSNLMVSPVKRALDFLKIGLQPVENIYQSLEKHEIDYIFCPLMFDLDGCFITSESENSIDSVDYKRQTINEIHSLLSEYRNESEHIDDLMKILCNDNIIESHTTDHFQIQENQLIDLRTKYADRIFPFFAVDPRRKELFDKPEEQVGIDGIINRLHINGGCFYGIKLYTPNGYSPLDDRLLPLYEYCEQYNIPITAHCSAGGFATFASSVDVRGVVCDSGKVAPVKGVYQFKNNGVLNKQRVAERAIALNHPMLWEEVLKQFPKLKINLAHFGAQDEGQQTEWTGYILKLMNIYPNLHTDLSSITNKSELEMMYKYYQNADSAVKARFLYGSDYYLNILFLTDMDEYMRNFTDVFSSLDLRQITIDNPIAFLNMN